MKAIDLGSITHVALTVTSVVDGQFHTSTVSVPRDELVPLWSGGVDRVVAALVARLSECGIVAGTAFVEGAD